MGTIRAILFDMDGTLVPMDEKAFTKGYFAELTAALAPCGLPPQELIAAMWAGVGAMVKNDGSRTNEAVFWQTFAACAPQADLESLKPATERFYNGAFHRAKAFTGENPLAAEAVRLARQKAGRVVLATNPIFPLCAQAARMSWVGLRPEDFDLVTAYEEERFCKPNPEYYRSICRRINVPPQQCLMIGNDETEDMFAAAEAGLQGWLVTDCRISGTDRPWQGPQGSFAWMVERLRGL